jgi:hypothetical protein
MAHYGSSRALLLLLLVLLVLLLLLMLLLLEELPDDETFPNVWSNIITNIPEMLNTLMGDDDGVEVEQALERRRRGLTESQIRSLAC